MDEPLNESQSPTLSLIVLHSTNVEVAMAFYKLLGLSFVEEKHAKGPRHYSATAGELLLEIYPRQGSNPPTPVRIGFRVLSLDNTLEMLRSRGARIVQEAADTPWGRRAVVEDPDGNYVELSPANPRNTVDNQ